MLNANILLTISQKKGDNFHSDYSKLDSCTFTISNVGHVFTSNAHTIERESVLTDITMSIINTMYSVGRIIHTINELLLHKDIKRFEVKNRRLNSQAKSDCHENLLN